MEILDQLIARFGGRPATDEEQRAFREQTGSWLRLLVVSPSGFVFKNPFSGDCDTRYIFYRRGDWKTATMRDCDNATPLIEMDVVLIHPEAASIYERAARLPLDDDDKRRVQKYVERGDILCAVAYLDGVEDELEGSDFRSWDGPLGIS